MRHSALGLVEVRGYLGAVAAADAALKAASVTCIGVEIIKGGLVTVKLDGDVGAVQAAVEAGAEMATQLDVLVARHVIARMHEETAALVAEPIDAHENAAGKNSSKNATATDALPLDEAKMEEGKTNTAAVDKNDAVHAASLKAQTAQANQAKETSKTEDPQVKTATDAKPKAGAAAKELHAKAVSAGAEGGRKVEERKPDSGHASTVQPTAKPAASSAEKANDAATSRGNGSASIVKPVPAPTSKRRKSTKKASL